MLRAPTPLIGSIFSLHSSWIFYLVANQDPALYSLCGSGSGFQKCRESDPQHCLYKICTYKRSCPLLKCSILWTVRDCCVDPTARTADPRISETSLCSRTHAHRRGWSTYSGFLLCHFGVNNNSIARGPPAWEASTLEKSHLDSLFHWLFGTSTPGRLDAPPVLHNIN